MYRVFYLILAVSLVPGPISSAKNETLHFPLEIFDVLDNHRLVIFLNSEDIAASPQWLPGEGAPPLTVAEVIERIGLEIEQDARLQGAEVQEIELKHIHGHNQVDRWYYLLQLRTHGEGKPKAYYFAVLLSGKVVSAIEEPASIK